MYPKHKHKLYKDERVNLYDNLVNKLKEDVKYTNLSFEDFVDRYFDMHTRDEYGRNVPLASFHKELVDKIEKHDKYEAVIQMARNHAKTTVFSLFLPIYLMLKNKTHFVLLINATKELAVKQLINIQTELESNEKLINDFGAFNKIGNWSKGNFIVDSYNTAFFCVGKGQSVRGLKYRNYRPDLVVVDDIDIDRDTRNINLINKQTNWVLQNVFPAMALKKYKFVVLGNKFASNMVLVNLMTEIKDIEILKVNAIDENGQPSWKERFALDDLMNIKNKIGNIRFQREFMNTPIIEGSVFKPEWIQWFKHTKQKYKLIITYIDPSFKKDGDFKAAVTIGLNDNKYYILDIYEVKTNMSYLFNYLYSIYNKWGNVHQFYIEGNFAQDLHKTTYDTVAKKREFFLPLVWDKSKKDNKEARIESMSIYFEQGLIFFNEVLKNTIHFKQFYNEYISFPTSKNDDGIDAMESCINTINKKIKSHEILLIGARQNNKLF